MSDAPETLGGLSPLAGRAYDAPAVADLTTARSISSWETNVNRTTPVLVASWLALVMASCVPERAAAQVTLTPRVIQIDQVKCAELQPAEDQKTERLLIYFNGYVDGMRRQKVWDERQVGQLIDRATAYCKANPGETVLSAFTRAAQ